MDILEGMGGGGKNSDVKRIPYTVLPLCNILFYKQNAFTHSRFLHQLRCCYYLLCCLLILVCICSCRVSQFIVTMQLWVTAYPRVTMQVLYSYSEVTPDCRYSAAEQSPTQPTIRILMCYTTESSLSCNLTNLNASSKVRLAKNPRYKSVVQIPGQTPVSHSPE